MYAAQYEFTKQSSRQARQTVHSKRAVLTVDIRRQYHVQNTRYHNDQDPSLNYRLEAGPTEDRLARERQNKQVHRYALFTAQNMLAHLHSAHCTVHTVS